MGCGASSPLDTPIYTHMIRTFDSVIRSLKVTKDEVDTLYLKWFEVDGNGDAFLSKEEFHTMLGMKESKITNRIFMILDRNGSGEVDFASARPARQVLHRTHTHISYPPLSLCNSTTTSPPKTGRVVLQLLAIPLLFAHEPHEPGLRAHRL